MDAGGSLATRKVWFPVTLHILADALWYGSLALIVLGATWTLGRQFLSEQRERRERE